MSQAKRRVLLVDDDVHIMKTVGKRLECERVDVVVASDGQGAGSLVSKIRGVLAGC